MLAAFGSHVLAARRDSGLELDARLRGSHVGSSSTRTGCSLKELACWLASLELYARSLSSHVLALKDSNPRRICSRGPSGTLAVLASLEP